MKQTFEDRRIAVNDGTNIGAEANERSFVFGAKFLAGAFIGAAIGALLTHYADPTLGRSRRAKLQDKGRHYLKEFEWEGKRRARNLRNRAKGLAYEASHRIQQSSASSVVDDETLLNRVRSTIGHKVSHPRSIHVDVKDACVTLSGVVLSNEVQGLVYKTRSIPGVRSVVSQLEMHSSSEHIPGLQ